MSILGSRDRDDYDSCEVVEEKWDPILELF
jgi:hypothetical protein